MKPHYFSAATFKSTRPIRLAMKSTARFLKEVFDRAGIEAKIIESVPGRGNIYARLRGDGSKKATVLLNHMGVVPAEGKLWKEPPFSGKIKDGVIWGRGALDDKRGGDYGVGGDVISSARRAFPV
jgi:acetylornithine deacetylase/succinyl-diaminopimelate desuccinylase-like protein